MSVDDFVAGAQIVGTLFVILSALWGGVQILRRIDGRLDHQDADAALIRQSVDELRKQADKQYGPNSGGIREAVNAIRIDVTAIKSQTAQNAENIAELRGAFNQSQSEHKP